MPRAHRVFLTNKLKLELPRAVILRHTPQEKVECPAFPDGFHHRFAQLYRPGFGGLRLVHCLHHVAGQCIDPLPRRGHRLFQSIPSSGK